MYVKPTKIFQAVNQTNPMLAHQVSDLTRWSNTFALANASDWWIPKIPGTYMFLDKGENFMTERYLESIGKVTKSIGTPYQINEILFRGDLPESKNDTKDIIGFFGDSFTMGQGVAHNEMFVNNISLDKSVLNLGMCGYGARTIADLFHAACRVYPNMQTAVITFPYIERFPWWNEFGRIQPLVTYTSPSDNRLWAKARNAYHRYFPSTNGFKILQESVNYIKLVSGFYGVDVVLGSWNADVYSYLTDTYNSEKILKFDVLDHGWDGAHPGPDSHSEYAGKVRKSITQKAYL